MSEILDYEYQWKSSGIVSDLDPRTSEEVPSYALGFKTPLEMGDESSGLFLLLFDPVDQIANNFKDLVLTNHGERLANPKYGANLKPLCTEYSNVDNFETLAMERIQQAVSNNLPVVELDTFTAAFVEDRDPGLLRVDMKIRYNISKLGAMGKILNISFYLI
jgi:phage baseplate assembly protein W